MQDIRQRLAELERRMTTTTPPTFEDFSVLWQGLSAFDRAAFEGDALGENHHIRGYLERLGVIDPAAPSLREIAKELERQGK